MRIVSLLPAATEIVYALGLGDELVGRSPADDHPSEASEVPVVAWADQGAGPSGPPAALTGDTGAASAPSHHIDLDALARARPDLVLTQRGCRACAVSQEQVQEAVRALGIDPTIVALEASTVEGILNGISTVGAFAEAEDEAVGLIEILRQRLAAVEDRVLERRLAGIAPRRVVVLGWLEPPLSSGRWVPEMVRRAGGWDLLGQEGQVPVEVGWDRVRDVDPDLLLLAPYGMDATASVRAWERAPMPVWLDSLRAARDGALVAVDGGGLLSRPGPRVIDGIAMLAEVLDPEGLAGFAPPGSWLRPGRTDDRVRRHRSRV